MTELLDVPGAAKGLDQLYPGWHDMVDIDRLDMFSCRNCILGQVGQATGTWTAPSSWVTLYGDFILRAGDVVDGVFADDWYMEQWVTEINARRFDWQEQLEKIAPREEVLA